MVMQTSFLTGVEGSRKIMMPTVDGEASGKEMGFELTREECLRLILP